MIADEIVEIYVRRYRLGVDIQPLLAEMKRDGVYLMGAIKVLCVGLGIPLQQAKETCVTSEAYSKDWASQQPFLDELEKEARTWGR